MPQHSNAAEAAQPKSKKAPIIAAIVIVVVALVVAIGAWVFFANQPEPVVESGESTALGVVDAADDGSIKNPIDWQAYQERNASVYAWLAVPGTNVDLPILQHPMADEYYLTHDIDGEPDLAGELFTQMFWNGKDFQDDVTLIYGHTFEDNSSYKDQMMSTLHNLEDPEFFAEHDEFYIYTPESRLTYKIVSAFEYDNRHILQTTNNFADPTVLQNWLDYVQSPDSLNKNVRAIEGGLAAGEDKLVILSTCTKPANDNARYLVVGVLENVEETVE